MSKTKLDTTPAIQESQQINETSMDPNVWGPTFWNILFYVCFHINVKEKYKEIMKLFNAIETLLPCSHCRRHYALYKKQYNPSTNIDTQDPESAAKWLWTIHDMVNQNLGKICIDYDKLVKKHKSLTCIISEFCIFDSIMFSLYATKQKEKVLDGIRGLIDLLESIHKFYVCELWSGVKEYDEDTFLSIKNKLLIYARLPCQSKDDFNNQYMQALAT